MASIAPRKDKDGNVVSYQVKVTRGRDKLTGKQLTPFTMTFTPPAGWSKKAIERELNRVAGEFEAACKRGEVLTREQAKAKAKAEQEQAEWERMEAERKPTFTKYLQCYISEIAIDHGAGTVFNYRKTLERAGKVFGDTRMEDITHIQLREYIADLQLNAVSSKGKPYSIETCRWHYLTLHAFFRHALENDVIPVNPMDRVKSPRQSKDTTTSTDNTKTYTAEEVKDILEQAAKERLKTYCLVQLALDSWMRRGELCGLRWSDINMATGLVRIERAIQYNCEKGLFITTPKNGTGREIYISQPTVKLLARWKKEQSEIFLKHGWNSPYVFTSDFKPEPLNPNMLTDRIKRFGTRTGYQGMHPHKFRHTGITLALLNGADITSVSRRAGHSSVGITMDIYSHSSEDAQKNIAETLGNVIGKI